MTCSECNECNECNPTPCTSCEEHCENKPCCELKIVEVEWSCIKVEEENGVYKLSTRCNPEIVSSDDSIEVWVDRSWEIDVWDIKAKDNKVWACPDDETPWTLIEKIITKPWSWLSIAAVWCPWQNGKVQLDFDPDVIDCPDEKVAVASWCTARYLADAITVNSDIIQASVSNCRLLITDKQQSRVYYAKMVLNQNKIWDDIWSLENNYKDNIKKSTWVWKPVATGKSQDARASFNRNCWIDTRWAIQIKRKWLYHVWFSGSMEMWFWIHAFRVQLYKSKSLEDIEELWKTIIESRYSAPLWRPIWMEQFNQSWLIKVPTEIDEETWLPTKYKDYKLDFPIIWELTEAEWIVYAQPFSQSMWAVLDRVPVNWDTIVELDNWDWIRPWVKISSEVKTIWMLWDSWTVPWHAALLWSWQSDWDNWDECWFAFFVDMIHAL